jgi:hypothetical protein
MSRLFLAAAAAVTLAVLGPDLAPAQKHQPLHHAIYEMREAKQELKLAKGDFGGHRDKAITALDAAIVQTEKALTAVGDPYKTFTPGKIYSKYKDYPHLRHAVVEMREAHRELKEAKGDFGGHRDKALKDLDFAIVQVEDCIKNIK